MKHSLRHLIALYLGLVIWQNLIGQFKGMV